MSSEVRELTCSKCTIGGEGWDRTRTPFSHKCNIPIRVCFGWRRAGLLDAEATRWGVKIKFVKIQKIDTPGLEDVLAKYEEGGSSKQAESAPVHQCISASVHLCTFGMAKMQTAMSEAEDFSLQRDREMKEAEGEAPAPVPAPAQEMLSRGELNS